MRLLLLAVSIAVAFAPPAPAVIHDLPDGDANIGAPASDDPGWAHVGKMGDFTGVYLGNRWVVSVKHVGPFDMVFDGVTYPWVPGSNVLFQNEDQTYIDLQVFRLQTAPELPMLPIRTTTPAPGTELFMAGQGRNRGAANGWQSPTCGTFPGYEWAAGRTLRWGRNVVEDPAAHPGLAQNPGNTLAFFTDFDQTGTDEAQAAKGDSGGAVFAKDPTSGAWELAGLMYTLGPHTCGLVAQPPKSSLYASYTYIVDLAAYRERILDVVLDCRNGVDDDGDGAVDHPSDDGCSGADDPSEELSEGPPYVPAVSACEIGGMSAAILVAAKVLRRRRCVPRASHLG